MKSRLTELRKSRGLSQKQLADILHISQSCISRIENNKCEISPFIIEDIADFFEVSSEYLSGHFSTKKFHDNKRISVIGINDYEDLITRYKTLNDEHKSAIKILLDFYYQLQIVPLNDTNENTSK